MYDEIRRIVREDKVPLVLLLGFILVASVIVSLTNLQPSAPSDGLRLYGGSSFPYLSFNRSKSYLYEGIETMDGDMAMRLYCRPEFHFCPDTQGRLNEARLVVYSYFDPKSAYQAIAIAHHFYVIALYEYSILLEDEQGWNASHSEYAWESPNEPMFFFRVDGGHDSVDVSKELILSSGALETAEFLDLGEIWLGASSGKDIWGYNMVFIDYVNSPVYTSFEGIKTVYHNQFAIKSLKRFVLLDEVTWLVHSGGLGEWKTLGTTSIYLGNEKIDGNTGNDSQILLTPYPDSSYNPM
ncbi:MAG: hypothetical protein ACFFFG_10515 [Candidatus Thorarchaeota archaeon]